MVSPYLVKPAEAAKALGVSHAHIKRLIAEATRPGKSKWKLGRELVDMARHGAKRRMLRVNLCAVVPGLEAQLPPQAGE